MIMNWTPHLKMELSNGIKTFRHEFFKAEASSKEFQDAFNKLKSNFELKEAENITCSVGY